MFVGGAIRVVRNDEAFGIRRQLGVGLGRVGRAVLRGAPNLGHGVHLLHRPRPLQPRRGRQPHGRGDRLQQRHVPELVPFVPRERALRAPVHVEQRRLRAAVPRPRGPVPKLQLVESEPGDGALFAPGQDRPTLALAQHVNPLALLRDAVSVVATRIGGDQPFAPVPRIGVRLRVVHDEHGPRVSVQTSPNVPDLNDQRAALGAYDALDQPIDRVPLGREILFGVLADVGLEILRPHRIEIEGAGRLVDHLELRHRLPRHSLQAAPLAAVDTLADDGVAPKPQVRAVAHARAGAGVRALVAAVLEGKDALEVGPRLARKLHLAQLRPGHRAWHELAPGVGGLQEAPPGGVVREEGALRI
mmetsp:Transcript_15194/g.44951  ORF Transcript_15194/g.44951 Transcript_15194/m.44951 type:complete len:359 (+) Transcript_15194:81-1157(+)